MVACDSLLAWTLAAFLAARASGLRVSRGAASVSGRSPCNGVNGSWHWEQHKDPAEYYSLENATDDRVGNMQKNFKPLGTQIYIRPFYWEYAPEREDCTFVKMNRASFCAGMERRSLTRFFVVGDSISYLMAESFWGLVGDGSGIGWQLNISGLHKKIKCPAGEVQFTFVRNDRLSNATEKEQCGDTCIPWWSTYVNDEQPTLLLANTGIHAHTLESFARDFDNFTGLLSSVSRRRLKDHVFFRSILPGHDNCFSLTSPFFKVKSFSLDGPEAKKYTWYLVPAFNEYAKQAAATFAASQPLSFTVLDAYMMTVLRPDGHRGDLGDCLHYYLPGAPDWWNHLLATELLA